MDSLLKCISKGLDKINDKAKEDNQSQDEDVKIAHGGGLHALKKQGVVCESKKCILLEYSIPLQLHKEAQNHILS